MTTQVDRYYAWSSQNDDSGMYRRLYKPCFADILSQLSTESVEFYQHRRVLHQRQFRERIKGFNQAEGWERECTNAGSGHQELQSVSFCVHCVHRVVTVSRFVVSGQSQDLNHTSAEQFRTYAVKFPDKFAGCAIWQAARATSAAPTYLPSISINGTEFIDGGIRFNNPSLLYVVF